HTPVLRFLEKYKPETPESEKARLKARAERKVSPKRGRATKRPHSSSGRQHCCQTRSNRKRRSCLIAHDVRSHRGSTDNTCLPASLVQEDGSSLLYSIGKKARLGTPCSNRKTCTCLAITQVIEAVKTNYNERYEEIKRHWGACLLGEQVDGAHCQDREKAKARSWPETGLVLCIFLLQVEN
ncbi:hypothetical protein LSTR_LSTR015820, partial [Laodelphax striatellus]